MSDPLRESCATSLLLQVTESQACRIKMGVDGFKEVHPGVILSNAQRVRVPERSLNPLLAAQWKGFDPYRMQQGTQQIQGKEGEGRRAQEGLQRTGDPACSSGQLLGGHAEEMKRQKEEQHIAGSPRSTSTSQRFPLSVSQPQSAP